MADENISAKYSLFYDLSQMMIKKMNHHTLSCFLILISLVSSFSIGRADDDDDDAEQAGTLSIAFASVGRASYAFDIYALPIDAAGGPSDEIRLTDGNSVNFNGYFPSSASLSMLPLASNYSKSPTHVLYITERTGSSSIYLDALDGMPNRVGLRSLFEVPSRPKHRLQVPLLSDQRSDGRVSMKDKPSLVGGNLIYVSTHENPGTPRSSWNAVYSTNLRTGLTQRLTPAKVADFSPSVSPSGKWTAVASYGEAGWPGDIEGLRTDIYVFSTRDGRNRVKIIEHGGWPSWVDDNTLYFHRKCEDGWWSVFRSSFSINEGVVAAETSRITPPGLHAFTPAAFIGDRTILAVATRRPGSLYRHIELYDVVSNKFIELTRPISPNAHHYNPFISPESRLVGYHRCRGSSSSSRSSDNGKNDNLLLENVQSPLPAISLFRIDGSFPSYSPDGDRIAFVSHPGLYVMNSDGSDVRKVTGQYAFSTAWDWKRKGVVYTSIGPTFAGESTKVDIVSINVDDEHSSYKMLTRGGKNNAFPSPSPDGKWVVFRSGRSGHKNLYIADALNGETGGLYRLTEGSWTDTMCNWSPDGEWIAFSSDRENPGSGSFELFKIHPNGTGLQKVIQSGLGGRTNHPWFSPDGEYIVLTSDYAGVSAEPISNPHQYQPYGDIFVIKSDGSEIQRLTHNSYEDGTPAWSPKFSSPVNVPWPNGGSKCLFDDCYWLDEGGDNQAVRSSHRRCAR